MWAMLALLGLHSSTHTDLSKDQDLTQSTCTASCLQIASS